MCVEGVPTSILFNTISVMKWFLLAPQRSFVQITSNNKFKISICFPILPPAKHKNSDCYQIQFLPDTGIVPLSIGKVCFGVTEKKNGQDTGNVIREDELWLAADLWRDLSPRYESLLKQIQHMWEKTYQNHLYMDVSCGISICMYIYIHIKYIYILYGTTWLYMAI